MNKGIVYLVQPSELIGTDRYKIGCSKNPNLDRCKNGYKKGTRYISIMECSDPLLIEKQIKEQFNSKFKLIAGYEYFEGNEQELLNEFISIVLQNQKNIPNDFECYGNSKDNKIDNEIIESNKNSNPKDNIADTNKFDMAENTCNNLINWQEDEFFGGNKQLIKIIIMKDKAVKIIYLNDGSVQQKIINNNIDFFSTLLSNEIIKDNTIYDLNDPDFIKNIDNHKKQLQIKLHTDNEMKIKSFNIKKLIKKNEKLFKIDLYFQNCIINKNYYCNLVDENNVVIDLNGIQPFNITFYKIKNKLYDLNYLRYYLPCCLEISNNQYYIINFNLEYIDLDHKLAVNDNNTNNINNDWNLIYLLDNTNSLSIDNLNMDNLKIIKSNFLELTDKKISNNLNKNTLQLLSYFK